ncbi:MAG: hypothetical protein RIQ78_478 [Bacteroidota bacterium]|jgi:hypothetical protein
MKYIFFLILIILALFSCSTPEKKTNLSLFCYVRYDEAVNGVKAEATLQDPTNKKSIEIPGGIRYQGMEMTLTPVYGLTYRYEYTAQFLPAHVFEVRDKNNSRQVFEMSIDPVKVFSLREKTISHSKPTVLQWEGAPLGKGETMVLMWENTAKGLTVPMEVSNTSGQSMIDIPSAKLKEIPPGAWTLYLVRKKLTKGLLGDIPTNGILEYYSKTLAVKITP